MATKKAFFFQKMKDVLSRSGLCLRRLSMKGYVISINNIKKVSIGCIDRKNIGSMLFSTYQHQSILYLCDRLIRL